MAEAQGPGEEEGGALFISPSPAPSSPPSLGQASRGGKVGKNNYVSPTRNGQGFPAINPWYASTPWSFSKSQVSAVSTA